MMLNDPTPSHCHAHATPKALLARHYEEGGWVGATSDSGGPGGSVEQRQLPEGTGTVEIQDLRMAKGWA